MIGFDEVVAGGIVVVTTGLVALGGLDDGGDTVRGVALSDGPEEMRPAVLS